MLTKMINITNAWKSNKSHTFQDAETRVDKTSTNIHGKAMKMIEMTTVFNVELISVAHTARSIQEWDTDLGMIFIGERCSDCTSHNPEDL